MEFIVIEIKPLFRTKELINKKTKASYGVFPHWAITNTIINLILFILSYLIFKTSLVVFSAEALALSVFLIGEIRCFLLYIIAMLYVNTQWNGTKKKTSRDGPRPLERHRDDSFDLLAAAETSDGQPGMRADPKEERM